eukprot:scaffold571_cov225-Isochrysis_galbana.AAC.2
MTYICHFQGASPLKRNALFLVRVWPFFRQGAPASAPALQSRRGRNTSVKGAQEGCQCSRIVMRVPCIHGIGRSTPPPPLYPH